MNKKLIIGGVVLLLVLSGGVFLFLSQQAQNAVKDLNANLPEEVRVAKSLLGNKYTVVNKIDGYGFKIPDVWKGISEIEYTSEREEEGFSGTSTFVIGKEGQMRTISVDAFEVNATEGLKQWAQSFVSTFGFTGSLEEQILANGFSIIRIAEDPSFGPYMYFVKSESKNYIFSGGSEEFIREIIANGKW